MRLFLWNAVLTLFVTSLIGALIPEPEVKIEVLQKPFICHRKTKGGDLMLVHYEGYLEKDGSLFHSTHKHNNGQPIWFTLGILEALKGWDQGLKGMCVGEKRKLIIPPALGYGKEGKGKIPPESTLIFNIDLLEIRNGPRSHESFQEMDLNDDWKLSKDEFCSGCPRERRLQPGFSTAGDLHLHQSLNLWVKKKEEEISPSNQAFTAIATHI
ncbi:peptidyl-prolyl cis-trans isomerase FKBP14 isoform X2 [Saimiri boliviensis]|uniref:peptidyl-prolyl cis-trans isomerase FKBP14 isoform X2 n=1 Tax=Saimiri boliviensis TaxID=27679 RepID=UPI003D7808E3